MPAIPARLRTACPVARTARGGVMAWWSSGQRTTPPHRRRPAPSRPSRMPTRDPLPDKRASTPSSTDPIASGRMRRSASRPLRTSGDRPNLMAVGPRWNILSMTAMSSSPTAAASACIARRSTSQSSWPAKGLASRKSTTVLDRQLMQYDVGYIDLEQRTLQTIDNPFGTRLSPMS